MTSIWLNWRNGIGARKLVAPGRLFVSGHFIPTFRLKSLSAKQPTAVFSFFLDVSRVKWRQKCCKKRI